MVFKIAGDALVKMDAVVPVHVVLLVGVEKEVGLSVGIDAGAQEAQRMLWHAYRVVVAVDDLQASLEVLRFGQ